ncbi:hypothetical protein ES288_A08G132200v1 [Gossypium darwinii]|uniref:Uncharacterized protein n=1 Tax=Gossypium darwinii TaxID=34276 RepID=A0A5D2FKX7_GOSDA|nr:hypothetical protein ES288_A08G132200v1 [Gossypium darwinii]
MRIELSVSHLRVEPSLYDSFSRAAHVLNFSLFGICWFYNGTGMLEDTVKTANIILIFHFVLGFFIRYNQI